MPRHGGDHPGAEHQRHCKWHKGHVLAAPAGVAMEVVAFGRHEQREADPHQDDAADDPHHAERHVEDLQQQRTEDKEEEQ